jgi:hypothetical protein
MLRVTDRQRLAVRPGVRSCHHDRPGSGRCSLVKDTPVLAVVPPAGSGTDEHVLGASEPDVSSDRLAL